MSLFLVKNTLLSLPCINRIKALPKNEEALSIIGETMNQFQKMKANASEMQTEVHLVKPLLKVLGFAFETKPKFFEEHVKGPDFALFGSDTERLRCSSLWGTTAYFRQVLGLLTIKRYGRNLEEGIGGFFLEFENRIPIYQCLYIMRVSGAPWSVLTNGKRWLLLKRPTANEKLMVELDLEAAVAGEDRETLNFFHHLFSANSFIHTLPTLLEDERDDLIGFLKERRAVLTRFLSPGIGKEAGQRAARSVYTELFPSRDFEAIQTREFSPKGRKAENLPPVKAFDQSNILTYLCTRGAGGEVPDFEKIIIELLGEDRSKEHLLALKLLDMTPGFGNMAVQLTEALAYLSFLLRYREKHSFVAEWENDRLLHGFILGQVLYGIERSPLAFEVLQGSLFTRFGYVAKNYREGSPLLGMSVNDLEALAEGKSQTGLFSRHPREVTKELKNMLHLYFSLSDRIKEDAAVKSEMESTIRLWTVRMKEIMDLVTASYFDGSLETNKIKELLYSMDGSEGLWTVARGTEWFRRAADTAKKKGFFHMEIEFPFLLNGRFDLIVAQPSLIYLWEEPVPAGEAVKAYIKRAMAFLKPEGKVLLAAHLSDDLVVDLKRSKRFVIEVREGAVLVRKRP
jgi:hypothetical protein